MSEVPMSPSNRRSSARIDARIEVDFRSGAEFVSCYSENISKGGIFLQTEVKPDPNAIIEVVLKPHGIAREVRLRGRVVRLLSLSENSKIIHKVALQFVELTPQVQAQLDRLYEEIVKSRPIITT